MIKVKEKEKKELHEKARDLYYNAELSISEIADILRKSERTMYRWIQQSNQSDSLVSHKRARKNGYSKKYPLEVFNRVRDLKIELPQRSAPTIHAMLKKEFPTKCPSISTIRKNVREQGLTDRSICQKQGYIRFERKKPNDLWQIDVAGVQTVGHLEKLYLVALLDDCSRFVVAAEYFENQKGITVLKVIRDAIVEYGRPNEILADNGTQFRNVIGDLGTKYSKLLESMSVKPIFARSSHPQTKGKLERWFGTVKQLFLLEARHFVKSNPQCSLADFNQQFKEWIQWYNIEKSHRSLPAKCSPAKIFFETEDRVFRPLQTNVDWNKWLNELAQRKVNKYNEIFYKAQMFKVPPGYSGLRIEVIEHEDKIEIYFKDSLLITHPYNVPIKPRETFKKIRKIAANGNISYKGTLYPIDYKLAGKTVEVHETNNGRNLLVFLHGKLITTLDS